MFPQLTFLEIFVFRTRKPLQAASVNKELSIYVFVNKVSTLPMCSILCAAEAKLEPDPKARTTRLVPLAVNACD